MNDAQIQLRIMPKIEGALRLDEIDDCDEINGHDEIDDQPVCSPGHPRASFTQYTMVRGVLFSHPSHPSVPHSNSNRQP